MIKKQLFFLHLLFIVNYTFSQSSQEIENKTLSCWSIQWTQKTETFLSEGISTLDNYYYKKRLIGERTIKDYEFFSNSTKEISIDKPIKDYDKIILVMKGPNDGAPNMADIYDDCFGPAWFSQMNKLDSMDVLFRLAEGLIDFSKLSTPDNWALRQYFFQVIKEGDMKRPLIKAIYYFFITSNSFLFGHQKSHSFTVPIIKE